MGQASLGLAMSVTHSEVCHTLSILGNQCHTKSFYVIQCHSMSFNVIQCHSMESKSIKKYAKVVVQSTHNFTNAATCIKLLSIGP